MEIYTPQQSAVFSFIFLRYPRVKPQRKKRLNACNIMVFLLVILLCFKYEKRARSPIVEPKNV